MRRKAIKELKRNYTWKGVYLCMKREYPPRSGHSGFWHLVFKPEEIYAQAERLSSGVFT